MSPPGHAASLGQRKLWLIFVVLHHRTVVHPKVAGEALACLVRTSLTRLDDLCVALGAIQASSNGCIQDGAHSRADRAPKSSNIELL